MEDDIKSAIVIDNGSDTCRAGFSDDHQPRVVCPSRVTYYTPQGKEKQQEEQHQQRQQQQVWKTADTTKYFGDDVPAQIGESRVSYPLDQGFVQDWDAMEDLWRHIFIDKLEVEASERNVLLSEKVFTPKPHREKATEMFETFGVGGFHLSKDAELVMHASGRLTGVCVDIGHTSSYVVPVYEGYWLPSEVLKFEITGRCLTKYLGELIEQQKQGPSNNNSNSSNSSNISNSSNSSTIISSINNENHIRKMKEHFCYVAWDYDDELQSASKSFDLDRSYYLPSGEVITINSERFRSGEALFQPRLLGEGKGWSLPETIKRSIMKCDLDIRKDLYHNIVLNGRTRFLPGLQDRLLMEVTGLAMNGVRTRIIQLRDEHLVFKGGCVFANVGIDGSVRKWIRRGEFDEYGPGAVHKMCF